MRVRPPHPPPLNCSSAIFLLTPPHPVLSTTRCLHLRTAAAQLQCRGRGRTLPAMTFLSRIKQTFILSSATSHQPSEHYTVLTQLFFRVRLPPCSVLNITTSTHILGCAHYHYICCSVVITLDFTLPEEVSVQPGARINNEPFSCMNSSQVLVGCGCRCESDTTNIKIPEPHALWAFI